VALRVRDIRTNAGVTTSSQLQDQEQLKLRVKLDARGRVGVNVGLFTGATFTAGWNNTGVGAGPRDYHLSVKQLFIDAQPVPAAGVTASAGSLYFWRGEATEITTFDNDGYLTGERLSIKRPRELLFDELSVTRAYVGDISTPSVFRRSDRLDDANYWQYAIAKALGKRVGMSFEYDVYNHAEILRGAARAAVPKLKVIDTLRLEGYRRVNQHAAGGFAMSGEKAVTKRITLLAGYGTIDPHFGALNGERYGIGRHVFSTGTLAVAPEISVGYYVARGIANDFRVPIGTRVEIIGTYNLLKRLRLTDRRTSPGA
jgi:hypothetical protein